MQPPKKRNRILSTILTVGSLTVVLLALICPSSRVAHDRLMLRKADSAKGTPGQARGSQPVSDAARQALAESYGKLPLSFEANIGQTDKQVRFLSRGSGYSLFLTGTEAVLTLRGPSEVANSGSRKPSRARAASSTTKRGAVLRMKLLGSNPAPIAKGLEELPGKSNYFIGSDQKQWRADIPTYGKVRIEGVYPGVDLVYYGNQRQLEYDFIVAPGADPSAIRLGFAGAERLEIDPQGELALRTHAGEVRWHKPVVYQEVGGVRRMVDGHYVRKGKRAVRFEVASYDPSRPLIIDPVLVYSTYLGGSGFDNARGIAVDIFGNAHVTGFANSTNFPTVLPAIQATSGGGQDAFVSKLNAAGSALIYSTYLGGSDFDEGHGIAVDSAGNAYITGVTLSTNFPTFLPIQPASGGGQDAFVTKLNAAGSALLYSTYLGGTGFDQGLGIAVDSSSAYVVGFTGSTNFPTTASAFQTAYGGGFSDAFVTKLNAAGSALVYSTYLGGSDAEDQINFSGIAVDSSGNAYVTGQTLSPNFPTLNPIQAALSGFADAFVTKLNAAGSTLVFSTYLGGTGVDEGMGIAVDSSGNAYVSGQTNSTDFPRLNPLQAANGGGEDAFVTKLNAAGALVYSTYLGGSLADSGRGVAVDSFANAYVTGGTLSSNFPTLDPIQATFGGGFGDAFVTKLNMAGNLLVYSTYLGGSSNDGGTGIAVGTTGNAFISGGTGSPNFPTTASAFQIVSGGANDGFVATIGVAGPTECTLTCPPDLFIQTSSTATSCGAVVTYSPTSSGCGTVTCSPPSGSVFAVGTTTVTCTADIAPAIINSALAAATCSFSITVVDETLPTVSCPNGFTATLPAGQTSTVVNYPAATASDNCGSVTVACVPPSGSTFPLGQTLITCTARDTAENLNRCFFFVTVLDGEPPVIRCPANVNASLPTGQTSTVVNYPPPTVTDNLPGTSVVCVPASGSSFPAGTTTVTCTATDAGNNRASCSFIVGVGGPQVRVTIPGNKTALEFNSPASRKVKAKNSPCTLFSIDNVGFAPLTLTLDSIVRTGSAVDSGRITDPNDTRFFSVSLVNSNQSLTSIDIGGAVTIQPGQSQNLCAKFAALIPALAGKTTGLAASNVLPDTLTSRIVFRQNAGANISIPISARVSTALVLINPSNPRAPAEVTFTRSGNDITVSYAVFDSNLDVTRAKYEFLNSGGQLVAGPFEIDLAASISQANLLKGQSFSVEQRFTGASSNPEATSVRLTVFDGETSVTAPSAASVTSISALGIQFINPTRKVRLYPPVIKLKPQLW